MTRTTVADAGRNRHGWCREAVPPLTARSPVPADGRADPDRDRRRPHDHRPRTTPRVGRGRRRAPQGDRSGGAWLRDGQGLDRFPRGAGVGSALSFRITAPAPGRDEPDVRAEALVARPDGPPHRADDAAPLAPRRIAPPDAGRPRLAVGRTLRLSGPHPRGSSGPGLPSRCPRRTPRAPGRGRATRRPAAAAVHAGDDGEDQARSAPAGPPTRRSRPSTRERRALRIRILARITCSPRADA